MNDKTSSSNSPFFIKIPNDNYDKPPKHQSLNLNEQGIGDQEAKDLARVLTENKTLKGIREAFKKITTIHFEPVNKIPEHSHTFLSLELNSNLIGDEGAIALANMLKNNTVLKMLTLVSNQFTDKGVLAIAEALKENDTLVSLNLGCNQIKDSGKKALAQMLTKNYTLTYLYFDARNHPDVENRIKRNQTMAGCLAKVREALDPGSPQDITKASLQSTLTYALSILKSTIPEIGTMEAPFNERHPIAQHYRLFQLLRDIANPSPSALISMLSRVTHRFDDPDIQKIADQVISCSLSARIEARKESSPNENAELTIAAAQVISSSKQITELTPAYLKSRIQFMQQVMMQEYATRGRLIEIAGRYVANKFHKNTNPFMQTPPTEKCIELSKGLLDHFSHDSATCFLMVVGLMRSNIKALEQFKRDISDEWLYLDANIREPELPQKIMTNMVADLEPAAVEFLLFLEETLRTQLGKSKVSMLTELLIDKLDKLSKPIDLRHA